MDRESDITMVGYDIIILPLSRWDGMYSSASFSIAKELSRFTRVFYIDNPFTWKDYFLTKNRDQIEKRKSALLSGKDAFMVPDQDLPNLVVATPELIYPANWLPPGFIYDAVSAANDRIVYKTIDRLMQEFGVKKFIFINSFNPLIGRFFPKSFSPALSIYHCVDDIANSEYISKHGEYLEEVAVRKADLTLVTSLELKRLKETQTPSVHYLPNAADVDLFRDSLNPSLRRPPELENIPSDKKIIFYMGNICHRVDYDLLVEIAANADYYLVMVGPRTNDSYRKAGLDRRHNVVFTGRKDLRDLPRYVKYSDCCIIPFRYTPLTKSIYPLKINEYLSAGKPVVTTNFSEDIANFAGVAFVSNSHQDFLDNIGIALKSDSGEEQSKRIAFSATNNWKARAVELLELINSKLI